MEKINGIIYEGKVYVVVETGTLLTCKECAFHKCCVQIDAPCADKFMTGRRTAIYRYSPELTEKINGRPNKRMCIRDKNKICDLCHECDIDISQPNY